MSKIKINDGLYDVDFIASIAPGKEQKSNGMFAFQADTEVELKNGKIINTAQTVEELESAIKAADGSANAIAEALSNIDYRLVDIATAIKNK